MYIVTVVTLSIFILQQVQALTNEFRSKVSDKIWGVIGPGDPTTAEFMAPIFHKEDLITVRVYSGKLTQKGILKPLAIPTLPLYVTL